VYHETPPHCSGVSINRNAGHELAARRVLEKYIHLV
jgi:hypothetical protein